MPRQTRATKLKDKSQHSDLVELDSKSKPKKLSEAKQPAKSKITKKVKAENEDEEPAKKEAHPAKRGRKRERAKEVKKEGEGEEEGPAHKKRNQQPQQWPEPTEPPETDLSDSPEEEQVQEIARTKSGRQVKQTAKAKQNEAAAAATAAAPPKKRGRPAKGRAATAQREEQPQLPAAGRKKPAGVRRTPPAPIAPPPFPLDSSVADAQGSAAMNLGTALTLGDPQQQALIDQPIRRTREAAPAPQMPPSPSRVRFGLSDPNDANDDNDPRQGSGSATSDLIVVDPAGQTPFHAGRARRRSRPFMNSEELQQQVRHYSRPLQENMREYFEDHRQHYADNVVDFLSNSIRPGDSSDSDVPSFGERDRSGTPGRPLLVGVDRETGEEVWLTTPPSRLPSGAPSPEPRPLPSWNTDMQRYVTGGEAPLDGQWFAEMDRIARQNERRQGEDRERAAAERRAAGREVEVWWEEYGPERDKRLRKRIAWFEARTKPGRKAQLIKVVYNEKGKPVTVPLTGELSSDKTRESIANFLGVTASELAFREVECDAPLEPLPLTRALLPAPVVPAPSPQNNRRGSAPGPSPATPMTVDAPPGSAPGKMHRAHFRRRVVPTEGQAEAQAQPQPQETQRLTEDQLQIHTQFAPVRQGWSDDRLRLYTRLVVEGTQQGLSQDQHELLNQLVREAAQRGMTQDQLQVHTQVALAAAQQRNIPHPPLPPWLLETFAQQRQREQEGRSPSAPPPHSPAGSLPDYKSPSSSAHTPRADALLDEVGRTIDSNAIANANQPRYPAVNPTNYPRPDPDGDPTINLNVNPANHPNVNPHMTPHIPRNDHPFVYWNDDPGLIDSSTSSDDPRPPQFRPRKYRPRDYLPHYRYFPRDTRLDHNPLPPSPGPNGRSAPGTPLHRGQLGELPLTAYGGHEPRGLPPLPPRKKKNEEGEEEDGDEEEVDEVVLPLPAHEIARVREVRQARMDRERDWQMQERLQPGRGRQWEEAGRDDGGGGGGSDDSGEDGDNDSDSDSNSDSDNDYGKEGRNRDAAQSSGINRFSVDPSPRFNPAYTDRDEYIDATGGLMDFISLDSAEAAALWHEVQTNGDALPVHAKYSVRYHPEQQKWKYLLGRNTRGLETWGDAEVYEKGMTERQFGLPVTKLPYASQQEAVKRDAPGTEQRLEREERALREELAQELWKPGDKLEMSAEETRRMPEDLWIRVRIPSEEVIPPEELGKRAERRREEAAFGKKVRVGEMFRGYDRDGTEAWGPIMLRDYDGPVEVVPREWYREERRQTEVDKQHKDLMRELADTWNEETSGMVMGRQRGIRARERQDLRDALARAKWAEDRLEKAAGEQESQGQAQGNSAAQIRTEDKRGVHQVVGWMDRAAKSQERMNEQRAERRRKREEKRQRAEEEAADEGYRNDAGNAGRSRKRPRGSRGGRDVRGGR